MRPAYLSGERVYLRAPAKPDATFATAWFPSPFPVSVARAEAYLKERLKAAWWPDDLYHLLIVRTEGEQIVGGIVVEHPRGPNAIARFTLAPFLTAAEADAVQADALRLLIPWLRDEVETMTATVGIPADQPVTLAAAAELLMVQATRLREFVARPGHRVDLLEHQALNPRRAVRDGLSATETV